ncbi:hypothetical protein MMC10_007540 [Thelotrema lepadinum]|nr:hypothetical protein [Thelotrema lepadinum]
MSSSANRDSNIYDNKQEFWEKYRAGRPKFPSSFYQRFYDYHASHGGSFGTVEDVGAGFGDMSLQLSKKFSHVIVSDPAPRSLDVARELMSSTVSDYASHFSFRQEKIEESKLPEYSVDAVFSSNALHWMDFEKAVPTMTRQLKPRGTLFICLCGIPRYHDPRIQQIWWNLINTSFDGLFVRTPSTEFNIRRASAIADNGYDCVALPESVFESGALRLKLNYLGEQDAFVFAPGSNGDLTYDSNVGPNDRLVEEVDKDYFFEVDTSGIRAKMASYPFDPDPQMLENHLSEIEKILDGGKCKGHWPVSIILATKRQ